MIFHFGLQLDSLLFVGSKVLSSKQNPTSSSTGDFRESLEKSLGVLEVGAPRWNQMNQVFILYVELIWNFNR